MAREKKNGKHINMYIEREILEQLDIYCEAVGQTKTTAIERILKSYLDEWEEEAKLVQD